MNSSEVPITFLYVFLVVTGAISVLIAIYKLANPDQNENKDHHSSIELRGFKFNAPAGFVYGLASIIGVVLLVRFDLNSDLKVEIENLNSEYASISKENESLKKQISNLLSSTNVETFAVDIDAHNPTTLFSGKIIVIYERNAFSPNTVEFKGASGVSKVLGQPFINGPIEITKGERLYLNIGSDIVWGVNVIGPYGEVLEFFREQ